MGEDAKEAVQAEPVEDFLTKVDKGLISADAMIKNLTPMAGEVTYQWEQAILRSLLKRGVHLGQEDVAGKFSGYTEAWIQEDFPAKSLAELMQLVHEDESNRPRSV